MHKKLRQILIQASLCLIACGVIGLAETYLANGSEAETQDETSQGQAIVSEEKKTKGEPISFSDYINETKPCYEDSDCEKMKCAAQDDKSVFKEPVVERITPPDMAKCVDQKCICPSAINAGKKFEPFRDFFEGSLTTTFQGANTDLINDLNKKK